MNDFIKLIKRFVPPYKKYVVLNIFFNILGALFSAVAFSFIIPVLEILFKTKDVVYTYMPVDFNGSMKGVKDALSNNFYWYISDIANTHSGISVLIGLSVVLIIMTFFKVATTYLGSYYIIPVRTGVVRDIRKQMNDKVLTLPIGFFSNE